MRNRQLISAWAVDKGQQERVITRENRNGKTYFVINDYAKLRGLFGQLLREIQRIKSEGDFDAGKNLVETYGVRIEPALHKEVLERYAKLDIAPYMGFIQPKLVPCHGRWKNHGYKGGVPKAFLDQMLEYGKHYSLLPVKNDRRLTATINRESVNWWNVLECILPVPTPVILFNSLFMRLRSLASK